MPLAHAEDTDSSTSSSNRGDVLVASPPITAHSPPFDQQYRRPSAPQNDLEPSGKYIDEERDFPLIAVVVLGVSTVAALLGVVSCLLLGGHFGAEGRRYFLGGIGERHCSAGGNGRRDLRQPLERNHCQNGGGRPPTATPMLSVVSAGASAGMGGMDRLRGGRSAARELAVTRDRQVRLHAVHTDLALNLPPSIALPDGEDHHHHHSYAAHSRLQLRDSEQESEIYQKCIRPPPNRTVLESESPPPYRSSSAGVLASSSSSSGSSYDWSSSGSAPLVVRCHSMSSTTSSLTFKGHGATSSSYHHTQNANHGGQKTDFLQRTVKIFTGKKQQTQSTQPHSSSTTSSATPVVIVPAQQRRDATSAQSSSGASATASTRHRPPV